MEENSAQKISEEQTSQTKQMSTSKKLAFFAIFAALVVVMQVIATVGGKFLTISPTLAFVPILLAIVTLGFWQGVALGFVFSTVVLIFGLTGYDSFTNLMFNYKPILTVVLIYVKGCLAPVVASLVYNALKNKIPKGSIWVASVILPIVNTGIFMIGALCFYQDFISGLPFFKTNVFVTVITVLVGVNFLIEFSVNVILTPVITDAKKVFDKRNY